MAPGAKTGLTEGAKFSGLRPMPPTPGWVGGGQKIMILIKKFTPQIGGSTLLPGRSGGHGWIRRFFLWIFHPVTTRSITPRPSSGPCENSASQNGGLGGFLGLLVSKIGFSESNCVQQTQRELLKSFLDLYRPWGGRELRGPDLDDSYANWARMALSPRRGANSCPVCVTFVKIRAEGEALPTQYLTIFDDI